MSSYAPKAVKNTHSETGSYQGTSTITPNMTPVALTDLHSLPSHLEYLPPSLCLCQLYSSFKKQVLPPTENLSLPLTPDPQGTGPSLPKQKLSSLRPGTLSSGSFLYLHSPGPKKAQFIPVDCR